MSSDVEHTTDCRVFSNSDCDCGLPYDRIAKLEQDLLNLRHQIASNIEAEANRREQRADGSIREHTIVILRTTASAIRRGQL